MVPQPLPARSYGAFWMSLAIYTTLAAAGVFVGTGTTTDQFPVKGDRLMLTLWGILVRLGWLAVCCSACSARAGSLQGVTRLSLSHPSVCAHPTLHS